MNFCSKKLKPIFKAVFFQSILIIKPIFHYLIHVLPFYFLSAFFFFVTLSQVFDLLFFSISRLFFSPHPPSLMMQITIPYNSLPCYKDFQGTARSRPRHWIRRGLGNPLSNHFEFLRSRYIALRRIEYLYMQLPQPKAFQYVLRHT